MEIRRIVSFLLVMLLAMMLVQPLACSAESEKTEVVVWEMYGPDRGMDRWVEQFNQSQDAIHVTDVFLPSHTELMQKLNVVAASGAELPDVILVDMFYTPIVDGLVGGLVDLNPYLDAQPGLREDFYDNLREYSNINGRQISLHGYANNLVLYYNKALFTEVGLDPNSPPETWDQLVEYAQKLTKDGQWGFHMSAFSDSYYETVSWQYQVLDWQNGGQMWTPDFKAAFNDEAGIGALQFMNDLLYNYKVATTAPPENGFQLGKIAMDLDGTWMNASFKEYLGDDLGAAILPSNVEKATNTGGEHWMIVPSDKATEDAAWQYIMFMLSEETVINICSNGGQVPTRKSISESEAFQSFADENPGIRASLDSLPYARMRAASPKYGEASEAISTYLQQAIFGTMTPEDALVQAETAWNKIMGF